MVSPPPHLRFLISTSPAAAPRGPTMTWQGRKQRNKRIDWSKNEEGCA
jgi:hypothetical protein